jgi:galactokinase
MSRLIKNFNKIFRNSPKYLITAPSRANLSGAHVDYFNGVTVSIAASNLVMKALLAPRNDGKVRFYSADLNRKIHILDEFGRRTSFQPLEYIQGAREVYKQKSGKKKIEGFDIFISSSIPIGGGMSSSSALSVIGALSFCLVNGFLSLNGDDSSYETDKIIEFIQNQSKEASDYLAQIAHIAGEAEWWYGTKGGKMDQFTISLAKKGQAFILDNKDFNFSYAGWPKSVSIAVCNTNVPHDQKRSGFASRKEQAETALKKIKKYFSDKKIETFRDVSRVMLEEAKESLSTLDYRRSLHPISEIEVRAPEFIGALETGDSDKLGKILSQTYLSLKNNYGTSCRQLDIMYKLAKEIEGFKGARITGGGFGGCLIALVEDKFLDSFLEKIEKEYNSQKEIKNQKIVGRFTGLISGRGVNLEKLS